MDNMEENTFLICNMMRFGDNKIYNRLQSVELDLNEADRLAETTDIRYTHEEVFEKIRNRVKK